MSPIPKPLSKTVQKRQIKRMKPKHYEILVRYSEGHRQRRIAQEMGIGEQWLSVIINSPIFQEELQKRWEPFEEELVKRLAERERRHIDALAHMMRTGEGNPDILKEPSVFDDMEVGDDDNEDPGLGDKIILEICRSRARKAENPQNTES